MQRTPSTAQESLPSQKVALLLDAINFLLADVRGALGPYLNVYLVTQQHWSQTSVGFVSLLSGILGLVAQTPIGAGIDRTDAKREAIAIALLFLALGAGIIFFSPTYFPVLIATSVMAVVGDVFGPAVAALTLGLYPRSQLARRMGRNSAFDHAGNVVIALAAGAVGYYLGQKAVFLLVPVFAILSVAAVLMVPAQAIDQKRARGLDEADSQARSQGKTFIPGRELLIFSFCCMLFHFANAPLLPLVGQKLAIMQPKLATAMMSSCIIAAQLVMLPIAVFVGNNADRWGRKPIFLVGFLILPIRALLYPVSDNPAWLIGIQLLDGVGAGILGALVPLVIADIMRGTPHYNVAQGFVATVQGIGASVSGLVSGWLVDHYGYNVAFFGLSLSAAVALVVYFLALPETKNEQLAETTT